MLYEFIRWLHHGYVRLVTNSMATIETIFFEPRLRGALKQLLNTGDQLQIIDVGANRGQSIHLYKKTFTNPKISAFEPSDEVFRKLVKKCKNLENVNLFNFGLGEYKSLATFYESALDETSTFAYPNTKSSYFRLKAFILLINEKSMFREKLVQIETLDNFMENQSIQRVDLLKIDVEGFELQVLKGAQKSLHAGKVFAIQMERHEDNMRSSQAEDISQYLTDFGFKRLVALKHSFGNFFEDIWVKIN